MVYGSPRLHKLAIESSSSLVLWWLSFSRSEEIRYEVAGNSHAPIRVVRKLLRDEMRVVRAAAARSPKLSPTEIGFLVRDPEKFVRLSVAGNQSTSSAWLEALLKDDVLVVRTTAASNPNLTTGRIKELVSGSKMLSGVGTGLVHNPNTSLDVLAALAKNEDAVIVSTAVRNFSEETWLKKLKEAGAEEFAGYPRDWVLKVLS